MYRLHQCGGMIGGSSEKLSNEAGSVTLVPISHE